MGILILLLLAITTAEEYVSYKNYKVYHVEPSSKEQLEILKSYKNNTNIDFWTPIYSASVEPVNIMAAPKFQNEFETNLKESNISFKITVHDVERVILEEKKAQDEAPPRQAGSITFDKYYSYDEIQAYLHQLAKKRPNMVSLEDYGTSYEKRKLTLIRIPSGNDTKKPIIFIDGGIHAREWISPAQVLYIIHMLVDQSESKQWIQNIDFIIIPLLNPDGYEYTRTTDRMWRKTRSKGKECIGVDPNRNFDYQWNGPGSESRECENTYAGEKPFSEPETTSYAGSCFLYPWCHTPVPPKNDPELRALGVKAAHAILRATGREYKVGTTFDILGAAAGCSSDWVYAVAGVELAYTVELPPSGHHNIFETLPRDILGVCKETYEGMKAIFGHIKEKHVLGKNETHHIYSVEYTNFATKLQSQNLFVMLFNIKILYLLQT